MKTRVALFNGSFDPPHVGHLAVIKSLNSSGLCDEIWLIPAAIQEHKKIPTKGEFRLKMLQLIVEDLLPNPNILILFSDFEITQSHELSTYQIKIKLERKYLDKDFLFVIGSEVLPTITHWPDGNKLMVTSTFILINRGDKKYKNLPKNILILPNFKPVDISSIYIRSEIKKGHDVSGFLSPSVLEYIQTNNLYKI